MSLVIHIEDDPLKARAIERLLRRLRPDLTYEHHGVANGGRRRLRDAKGIVAVITDWTMPLHEADGVKEHDAGALVVRDCEVFGLPVLVVSGQDKPWAHRHLEVPWLRFDASLDIVGELRAFLDTV